MTASWVGMIVTLLEKGEERLVTAVESGLIPLSLAIDIARADHAEVQNVLMDAYAAGKIKGKKLVTVRRLLDQRVKRSKAFGDNGLGPQNPPSKDHAPPTSCGFTNARRRSSAYSSRNPTTRRQSCYSSLRHSKIS